MPSELEESTSVYVDGQYTVTVPYIPDASRGFSQNNLTLTVVIKNDRITEVRNVFGYGGSGNDSYIKRAINGTTKYLGVVNQITDVSIVSAEGEDQSYLSMAENMLSAIVEAQSADVDTVTGATFSSTGIKNAAAQALEKAER